MEGLTDEVAREVGLSDQEYQILYVHKVSDASFESIGRMHGMTKQGAHYHYRRAIRKLADHGYAFVVEERLTRTSDHV